MCIKKKKKEEPKDNIESQLEKKDLFSMNIAAFITIFLPTVGIVIALVLFTMLIFGILF